MRAGTSLRTQLDFAGYRERQASDPSSRCDGTCRSAGAPSRSEGGSSGSVSTTARSGGAGGTLDVEPDGRVSWHRRPTCDATTDARPERRWPRRSAPPRRRRSSRRRCRAMRVRASRSLTASARADVEGGAEGPRREPTSRQAHGEARGGSARDRLAAGDRIRRRPAQGPRRLRREEARQDDQAAAQAGETGPEDGGLRRAACRHGVHHHAQPTRSRPRPISSASTSWERRYREAPIYGRALRLRACAMTPTTHEIYDPVGPLGVRRAPLDCGVRGVHSRPGPTTRSMQPTSSASRRSRSSSAEG